MLIPSILQPSLALAYLAIRLIVMLFAVYCVGRCALGIMSSATDFAKSRREWAPDELNRRVILNTRREAKLRFVTSVVGLAIAVLVGKFAFNVAARGLFWK